MNIKKLEDLGIKKIKIFDKGKRGIIYTGDYKNKKVAIKIRNPKSEAKNKIQNEAKFLKILNKYEIGPELLLSDKDYIVYKFVNGNFIIDFIKKFSKSKIKDVIYDILEQCYIMDKLKINKLEMHHPLKHILIDKKPVLIDFERAYYTEKPKNVSQFCQFLINSKNLLEKKNLDLNENLIDVVRNYKSKTSKFAFLSLKNSIFLN